MFKYCKTFYHFSCDGSFEVMSLITTEISQGVARGASKYAFETVSFVWTKGFSFIKMILQNAHFILHFIKLYTITCMNDSDENRI